MTKHKMKLTDSSIDHLAYALMRRMPQVILRDAEQHAGFLTATVMETLYSVVPGDHAKEDANDLVRLLIQMYNDAATYDWLEDKDNQMLMRRIALHFGHYIPDDQKVYVGLEDFADKIVRALDEAKVVRGSLRMISREAYEVLKAAVDPQKDDDVTADTLVRRLVEDTKDPKSTIDAAHRDSILAVLGEPINHTDMHTLIDVLVSRYKSMLDLDPFEVTRPTAGMLRNRFAGLSGTMTIDQLVAKLLRRELEATRAWDELQATADANERLTLSPETMAALEKQAEVDQGDGHADDMVSNMLLVPDSSVMSGQSYEDLFHYVRKNIPRVNLTEDDVWKVSADSLAVFQTEELERLHAEVDRASNLVNSMRSQRDEAYRTIGDMTERDLLEAAAITISRDTYNRLETTVHNELGGIVYRDVEGGAREPDKTADSLVGRLVRGYDALFRQYDSVRSQRDAATTMVESLRTASLEDATDTRIGVGGIKAIGAELVGAKPTWIAHIPVPEQMADRQAEITWTATLPDGEFEEQTAMEEELGLPKEPKYVEPSLRDAAVDAMNRGMESVREHHQRTSLPTMVAMTTPDLPSDVIGTLYGAPWRGSKPTEEAPSGPVDVVSAPDGLVAPETARINASAAIRDRVMGQTYGVELTARDAQLLANHFHARGRL